MLKGRTTIQLRNAKTGEIEQEVTEENLVTNAVQNMMSMPYFVRVSRGNNTAQYTSGADFERFILHKNYPIYEHAYGGVAIFKDTHDESVDKIMPDGTNELVGYASGISFAEIEDDVRCGELNATESKALDNGYHFVWDFDTEKANGAFKSVSLGCYDKNCYNIATDKGFACGLSNQLKLEEEYIGLVDFAIASPKAPEDTPTQMYPFIVKIEETSDHQFIDVYAVFFARSDSVVKMQIEKIRLRMPHTRSIVQKAVFAEVQRDTLLGWTTPPKFYRDSYWVRDDRYYTAFLDDDKINVIYKNSDNLNTHITHTIYGLDGEQISTTDVIVPEDIPFYTNSSYENVYFPAIYRDGYYYSLVKNKIIRYNAQGVLKDSLDLVVDTGSLSASYIVFDSNGCLEVYANNSNSYARIQVNDSGMSLIRHAPLNYRLNLPVPNNIAALKQPWSLRAASNTINVYLTIELSPYYLGTINNLEKSITKTDAQTMKIIYDLTEEAEE